MPQIYTIEFVQEALREAGWKTIPSIEPWIIIPVESEQETVFLSLCYYENAKILFVKGLIAESIKKENEDILMEFIQTGNHHLAISNFEYDVQNKELNCRSGFYFENLELSMQLIHNAVYEIYDNVLQYKPLVTKLFTHQKTVKELFADK